MPFKLDTPRAPRTKVVHVHHHHYPDNDEYAEDNYVEDEYTEDEYAED